MSEQANRERLARLQKEAGGDLREAVRQFTGRPLTDVARAMGVARSDLGMCLGFQYGRRYNGIRRALELQLELPQYSLDARIEEHARCMELALGQDPNPTGE